MVCRLFGAKPLPLNKYWLIVKFGPLETYNSAKFNQNLFIDYIRTNTFKYIICEMAAMLFRLQYVNI